MFRFLRRHRTVLYLFIAICIVGSVLFFGVGSSTVSHSPQDVVLKINDKKIRQAEYEKMLTQLARQKSNLKPEERQHLEQEAFQELIRTEVFNQEAEKYGLVVPDQELQHLLAATPAFQKDGHFDMGAYYMTLRQVVGMKPEEFEKLRRKDIAAHKLTQVIQSSVQVPEALFQMVLQERLKLETDKKKKEEILNNPDIIRNEIQQKEFSVVMNDWLKSVNNNLKIEFTSDLFRQRINAAPASAPASTPAAK